MVGQGEASVGAPATAVQAGGAPRVLGEYRLVKKLGEGGMAQVLLARHLRTGQRVALKVLHPHFAANPELVRRLRVEANALNQIGHENVVRILALREDAPTPYLVMEYLDGLPLTKLMGEAVAPRTAIPLLVQVCRALEAAHRRGVLHRDLKPDNILLVPRPRGRALVKVVDFGLAVALAGGGVLPGDGPLGTARYMAPEQWLGRPLDGRTDLYALGVIAFGLATGRPPFGGRDEEQLRRAHCHRPAPDPRSIHPGVPEPWARAILKALAKAPEERFQSAAAFAEALEAVPRGQALPERRVDPPPSGPGPEVERVLGCALGSLGGDPYVVLQARPGASMAEIWRCGAQRLSELSALVEGGASGAHPEELAQARARVVRALCQLGLPHRRIARDAASGNLAGVARCIAAMGVRATEAIRAARPLPREAARLARRYRRLGDAWARRGRIARAVGAYEQALRHDPLDVEAHRRYWALRRELLQGDAAPRGEPASAEPIHPVAPSGPEAP